MKRICRFSSNHHRSVFSSAQNQNNLLANGIGALARSMWASLPWLQRRSVLGVGVIKYKIVIYRIHDKARL